MCPYCNESGLDCNELNLHLEYCGLTQEDDMAHFLVEQENEELDRLYPDSGNDLDDAKDSWLPFDANDYQRDDRPYTSKELL